QRILDLCVASELRRALCVELPQNLMLAFLEQTSDAAVWTLFSAECMFSGACYVAAEPWPGAAASAEAYMSECGAVRILIDFEQAESERHIVLEGGKVSLQRSINDAMLARDTGAPSGAPADVRLVASLGGGVAERCAHGSCDLELHACCPHCLQQLCCEHWRSSLCHEHGSAATCRCGDCKLVASARTNTYASNANHEEALDIELTPTQSAQSLTSEQGESLMLAEDDGHEE
ncbi:unnamed protein product, partial [Effrenium voratum]